GQIHDVERYRLLPEDPVDHLLVTAGSNQAIDKELASSIEPEVQGLKYLFIEDYRNVVLYAGKIGFNQVAQRAIDRDRNQVDFFQLVDYRGLNLFVEDFIGLQVARLILLDFLDQVAKECVQDRIGSDIPVG